MLRRNFIKAVSVVIVTPMVKAIPVAVILPEIVFDIHGWPVSNIDNIRAISTHLHNYQDSQYTLIQLNNWRLLAKIKLNSVYGNNVNHTYGSYGTSKFYDQKTHMSTSASVIVKTAMKELEKIKGLKHA